MSVSKTPPQQPGLLWRTASTFVMAATGMLARAFLYGLNDVEVVGLDRFLALLDTRKDVDSRQRGLITVSNHVSVLDDPLIWGVLPFRYAINHQNLRWSLGSHDICYKNSLAGHFFCAGQTLPTHRLRHSPWGGLYQPTINQAIRLLSHPPPPAPKERLDAPPVLSSSASPSQSPSSVPPSLSLSDSDAPPLSVFASSFPRNLYYSTNNVDRWPAPSVYASNRFAWVHIFPEGLVHQQRDRSLRYFKWGVARLILESEPAPDIVPMFIDGPDRIMPEDRTFLRFFPRVGQSIRIVLGDVLDPAAFADLRARWKLLVLQSRGRADSIDNGTTGGHKQPDLWYGLEAQQLRIEASQRIRNEILKLRRRFGYPEEDPALALAESWAEEPNKRRYRSRVDNSIVYQD
ncbi:tafazzin [Niveomyces insectorum RCEF 264]|uniref:Tafazzin family protein n=1 Tax=Niveomyces insectorum RCEF 264 TaxID=1081102 RepID=A0A167LQK2_9HYPO|nr:tafazzin [Niveomyces insectorum RCEF 264]